MKLSSRGVISSAVGPVDVDFLGAPGGLMASSKFNFTPSCELKVKSLGAFTGAPGAWSVVEMDNESIPFVSALKLDSNTSVIGGGMA